LTDPDAEVDGRAPGHFTIATQGASSSSAVNLVELGRQGELLVDRLRSMALTRLEAPYSPEPTRIFAAHALAGKLTDLAAGLEHPQDPIWRVLPIVGATAIGDLVAVCLHDVQAAVGSADLVQLRDGTKVRAADEMAELTQACLLLRRRL
jgi:hypothetical protein